MDFSKLKSLASKGCSQHKVDFSQQDNTGCSQNKTELGTQKDCKNLYNQQCSQRSQRSQLKTDTLENVKSDLKPNNLKNDEVNEVIDDNLARGEVTKNLGTLGTLGTEDTTTKEKDFDLSNLFVCFITSNAHEKPVPNYEKDLGTLGTSPFDELGYVSDKYDHLSEQSSRVQVEAVMPQQVLGIVETGLERKVFDHLKRYGACQLKTAAKEMNENEQAIRQVVQNSTLVEYRKGIDECGAWESLLPNEIDYPARFVAFIESQEKIEIDDVFVLLEQCEAYIRQHDQESLKEWLDFFSRVVRFYRVDVPLLTSLRDAWRFRDTENAIWV